jgi:ABC-2 type transport system permease protein
MVGVLIEMRAAVTRRRTTGKRTLGTAALVLFVTLLTVATLAAGLKHHHYQGAGANVVATLCFGWLLGWVSGPLITGDDAALRMDYFKLLPIPAASSATPCWAPPSPTCRWRSAWSRSAPWSRSARSPVPRPR